MPLLTVAVGCSGSGGSREAPIADQIAPRQGLVNRVLEAEVNLTISGAFEDSWQGMTPLNVLTNVGGAIDESLWLLTVGVLPEDILESEADRRLRPAFDLVGYHGNDEYTIDPVSTGGLTESELREATEDPESLAQHAAGPINSSAFVVVDQGDLGVTNFNVLLEPCTLTVERNGNRGSIDCSSLTNGTDRISLRWSWNANPDKVTRDLRTEDSPTSTTTPGATTSIPAAVTTTTAPTPARGEAENEEPAIPLEVDVEPTGCLSPGTVIKVRVISVAGAFVTVIHTYSDGDHYGNTALGSTDDQGKFNWAFAVPAGVPPGQTHLLVQVSTGEASEGHAQPVGDVRVSCP